MGESYLQRKVFSRMGRIKTQSSSAMALNNNDGSNTNNNNNSHNNNARGSTARSSSAVEARPHLQTSTSSAELDTAQPSQPATIDGTSKSMSSHQLADCMDQPASFEVINSDVVPTLPATETAAAVSTTTTRQLAPVIRLNPEEADSSSRGGNGGQATQHKRLKGASKAIILFRRAASTLSNMATSAGDRSVLRPLNMTSPQHQQTNGGMDIPQFIVPKLNTLRSPLVCRIRSVDGALMREVFVNRYHDGQYLIDNLKVSVGICDSKYLGLKLAKTCDEQDDLRGLWICLSSQIFKQIKNKCDQMQTLKRSQNNNSPQRGQQTQASNSGAPLSEESSRIINDMSTSGTMWSVDLYLRIKFYPPNLSRIQDNFLHDYLWLQLRRDLRLGKLTSSLENLTFLMACILQYEFGNFQEDKCSLVPSLIMVQNQDLFEDKAIDLWRTRLHGMKRHQAQMQFLRGAIILETYGFDYYQVKDHERQRAYLLGFNYAGIKTIRNGRIAQHFRWHSISRISHERRMIILHVQPNENSRRKQILGFKCLSNEDCETLLMRLQEQKYFFTVELALFDKSVRQPSDLYVASSSDALLTQWNQPNDSDDYPSSGDPAPVVAPVRSAAAPPPTTTADCNYNHHSPPLKSYSQPVPPTAGHQSTADSLYSPLVVGCQLPNEHMSHSAGGHQHRAHLMQHQHINGCLDTVEEKQATANGWPQTRPSPNGPKSSQVNALVVAGLNAVHCHQQDTNCISSLARAQPAIKASKLLDNLAAAAAAIVSSPLMSHCRGLDGEPCTTSAATDDGLADADREPPSPSTATTTTVRRAGMTDEPFRLAEADSVGALRQESMWTKVYSCIRWLPLLGQSSTDQTQRQHLAEQITGDCQLICSREQQPQAVRSASSPDLANLVLSPIVKFCIMALLANFAIKAADNVFTLVVRMFELSPSRTGQNN